MTFKVRKTIKTKNLKDRHYTISVIASKELTINENNKDKTCNDKKIQY